jgi:hypothetical protein
MSIDWWDTLIIGLLVLGGAGAYGIWRAARMVRAWRRAGRLVDSLADIDAYSDELEPLPDEWDDQTLAELRDGCLHCGAEVGHYLGCPADPNPDYEAEAKLQAEQERLPDEWDDQTLAQLRDETPRGPRCGCCGTKETRPGEITCSQCAGWEDHAMDHEATGHRQIYPAPHAPEHERLPEMLYADGYPVFASLLESAAWDAHWEQAWGELQRARESAWEWYHDAARCWAGVATGTFPAVTG